MTEKEKMLAGELYFGDDPELTQDRRRAAKICSAYNTSGARRTKKRHRLLSKLFADSGESCIIIPPFYCDYGYNISAGENFYANFGCVFLDVNRIIIGNNVLLGPQVQLYSATHPLDPQTRLDMLEFGKPVHIGDNVWIGGGTIICPDVQIGNNAVIGAGSVVRKNIPPGVVAAGNPCRIVGEI